MIGSHLTIEELKRHLQRLAPTRSIDSVVVHHFYRPTADVWRGRQTLETVRRLHVQTNGWADIGYHIVVGPDDTIWLARPIEDAGAHCKGHNDTSIGVAFAADFDTENPADNGLATGQKAVAAICDRFGIPDECVFFHRDFSPKSCPGTKMNREDFRRAVRLLSAGKG